MQLMEEIAASHIQDGGGLFSGYLMEADVDGTFDGDSSSKVKHQSQVCKALIYLVSDQLVYQTQPRVDLL